MDEFEYYDYDCLDIAPCDFDGMGIDAEGNIFYV